MKRSHVAFALTGLLVALPIAAYALVKPLRVVAPALVPGVSCPSADICTDDVAKLGDAQQLYRDGYARAAAAVGAFRAAPRVVFCATRTCADAFGLGTRAALTLGDFGVVIAPHGWQTYFLAHELIHHRQAEVLGNLAVLTKPRWLIEGMAYALSDDPRHPLAQPFESWRTQFAAWNAARGTQPLWDAARAIE
ncbi:MULTISPECIES: membrane protein [Burkholderia]|uniref:membrane protein n=1 Tax=Burkholderia TaxID=32008 RepID=UPI0003F8509F|nr:MULTISPECIES: membrane protein [Burkholderia]